MDKGHRIWFERPILSDLVDGVSAQTQILGPGTDDEPYRGLSQARGVMAGMFDYDSDLMDRAPDLRVIVRTGIGVDTVDIAEATRRGIAVCNTPDGPTVSTAEQAVTLMLSVAKNVKRSEIRLRNGELDLYGAHTAMELEGKTLGLAGFGRIARRVAAAGRGLGMDVIAYDPFLEASAFEGATPVDSMSELLGSSDVLSIHIPLTPDSHHAFGTEEFAAMKDGAVFVNTARGGLVDQDALLAALDSGKLMGAGLDVTDPEPLDADHPLLHRADVVVTPHVASGTHDGKRRIFRMALDQAIQVLDGQRPPHLVNPEVWDKLRP